MGIARSIDGFDYDSFFRSLAWTLSAVMTEDASESYIASNPHPIPFVRVNVLLSQQPEFQELYGVQSGDAMYVAGEDRIGVWGMNSNPQKATLTFDLGGGTLDGRTGTIVVEANVGDTITLPGTPVRSGYEFLYWKGSQYAAGAEYVVTGDHAFTATWEKIPAPVPTPTPTLTPTPTPTSTTGNKTSSSGTVSSAAKSSSLPRTGDLASVATAAVLAASGVASLTGAVVLRPGKRMRGRYPRR